MERSIAADPLAAPIIPGSGGIRKLGRVGARQARRNSDYSETATIYLLTIYAKADREDLEPGDLTAWARLVATIKERRHDW